MKTEAENRGFLWLSLNHQDGKEEKQLFLPITQMKQCHFYLHITNLA